MQGFSKILVPLCLVAVLMLGMGIFFLLTSLSQVVISDNASTRTVVLPTPTVSFVPIASISPKQEKPRGEICIQVIAYAVNPQTGTCQQFPTPCDIPDGWEKVQHC